ncbi:hypothetical protein D5S17_31850 [Pseudonocardiaceae bacterium YIM PH 21723]|nr:hypothetical protein D5S17_31850 [Pseudonocardiaceae bacterium YIM PH 21723]
MPTDVQPGREMIDQVRHIPIYQKSLEKGHFPILEKSDIAAGFPDNWMTPQLSEALADGRAEYVWSTGTNHARMRLIRPPLFLLKSYYRLWSEHPDIKHTWAQGCHRVSLTTVLATEHVARVNAAKTGAEPQARPALADRRLDDRTVYLNLNLDPALWDRAEVERMLIEIDQVRDTHPLGWYHLDCSSYHLAHLVRKAQEFDLWHRFPRPASIIHAYEYTPAGVGAYLREHFDCPVIDLFGSTELGYLYYNDRVGDYHPYLHEMNVELVPLQDDVFSIIISSVRNPYMPLIRYRTGDCAQTTDGSADPAKVRRFCGREKELLRVGDRLISQAHLDDWIHEVVPGVFTYQLHVWPGRAAGLRYTTFDGRPGDPVKLAETVSARTGLNCAAEHTQHIPIGRSGKYAWLINES